jgi:hypothetical protein
MSKIGLVPMAAKPYHAGHHALVEKAARENDQVKLFISVTDRARSGEAIIRGEDMVSVWQNYLEPLLPSNVVPMYVSNPVREVYKSLEAAEDYGDPDIFYMVYSDPSDTASNYPEAYRQKYFPQIYNSGNVQFAAECDGPGCTRGVGTPDISGTKMREYLEKGDFKAFSANMPAGANAKAIYDILRGETAIREYVKVIWAGGLK